MRLIDADEIRFPGSVPLVYGSYQTGYAAAIRDLEKQIDAIPAVNRWFSVKDRLPETDDDVIVYTCGKTVKMGFYYKGRWWDTAEGYDINVLYWQPRPADPKEEG